MGLVPNVNDPNREDEIKRMHRIANGPEGKERIKKEFGIDLEKGPLPDVVSSDAKTSGESKEPVRSNKPSRNNNNNNNK